MGSYEIGVTLLVIKPTGGSGPEPLTPSLHKQQQITDIFLLTKHLPHLPPLNRQTVKEKKKNNKKGRKRCQVLWLWIKRAPPPTAMQMSSSVWVKWPFVFTIWSVSRLLWSCPMSHRSKPTVLKMLPQFGEQTVQSVLVSSPPKTTTSCEIYSSD